MKFGNMIAVSMIFSILLISTTGASARNIENLILMTEEYPPFNFEENGELKGFSVDLMEAMLFQMKAFLGRKDIRIMPWANAYNKTLKLPNTVLFAMSRTAPREKLFKWVGPLAVNKISLMGLKTKGIRLAAIEDAGKYRIGTVRDDSGESLLVQAGLDISGFQRVSSILSLIKMAQAGRIDMFAYGDLTSKYLIKKNGMNPDDFEIIYSLDTVEAFYAFHKETDDAVIGRFQEALDAIKSKPADGGKSRYEMIMDKYR